MLALQIDEMFQWSGEHLEELCQVIAKGGGKRLSSAEGKTARKGHGHCLRALSLLAADKKTCTILTANTHTLALLLKGLFEHGIEYPQDISYHDLCSPALGVTCLNCAISSEVAQKYQCTKIFPIGLE
eukprot:3342776-Rhodomonas_salina.5